MGKTRGNDGAEARVGEITAEWGTRDEPPHLEAAPVWLRCKSRLPYSIQEGSALQDCRCPLLHARMCDIHIHTQRRALSAFYRHVALVVRNRHPPSPRPLLVHPCMGSAHLSPDFTSLPLLIACDEQRKPHFTFKYYNSVQVRTVLPCPALFCTALLVQNIVPSPHLG